MLLSLSVCLGGGGDGHFSCIQLQAQPDHNLCRWSGLVFWLIDAKMMKSGLNNGEVGCSFFFGGLHTPKIINVSDDS